MIALVDFAAVSPSASDECNVLSASLCRIVNADSYTVLLAIWASLQLTWVTMLLFVQFAQVSRAMTTYENMFGIDSHAGALPNSAFTSTGVPLAQGRLSANRVCSSAGQRAGWPRA